MHDYSRQICIALNMIQIIIVYGTWVIRVLSSSIACSFSLKAFLAATFTLLIGRRCRSRPLVLFPGKWEIHTALSIDFTILGLELLTWGFCISPSLLTLWAAHRGRIRNPALKLKHFKIQARHWCTGWPSWRSGCVNPPVSSKTKVAF